MTRVQPFFADLTSVTRFSHILHTSHCLTNKSKESKTLASNGPDYQTCLKEEPYLFHIATNNFLHSVLDLWKRTLALKKKLKTWTFSMNCWWHDVTPMPICTPNYSAIFWVSESEKKWPGCSWVLWSPSFPDLLIRGLQSVMGFINGTERQNLFSSTMDFKGK